jgi:hypothetical protein
MFMNSTSKYRVQCIRSLFVLGIVFYLIKGQSVLYASDGCSGDPIATTVELVLSDTPEYECCFQPSATLAFSAAPAFVLPASDFYSGHSFLSARHNVLTRLVLKSCEYAYVCQPRSTLFCKTRTIRNQSSSADPLPIQV